MLTFHRYMWILGMCESGALVKNEADTKDAIRKFSYSSVKKNKLLTLPSFINCIMFYFLFTFKSLVYKYSAAVTLFNNFSDHFEDNFNIFNKDQIDQTIKADY